MSDTERMRDALQRLVELCEDSDDARYGTLSTSTVRDMCTRALAVPEQAPETHIELGPFGRFYKGRVSISGDGKASTTVADIVASEAWARDVAAAPAALPDGKDAERWRMLREIGACVDVKDEDGWHSTLLKGDALDAAIDAAIQAQTEGERAPSPASASTVPQGGDAAANQGGER